MLEDTVRIFEPVAFTSSDKFSGDFQVHFVQDLASFESTYGQTARADLEIDGFVRIYEKDIPAVEAPDSRRRLYFFLQKEYVIAEEFEDFLGSVFKRIQQLKLESFDMGIPNKLNPHKLGYYIEVLNYRFSLRTTYGKDKEFAVKKINIVSSDAHLTSSKEWKYYHLLGKSRNLSRALTNSRSNSFKTLWFAEDAQNRVGSSARKNSLKLTVIQGEELLAKKINLIHAVGKGSAQPPLLLNIEYKGNPSSQEFIGLVGKGIVFDQGGMNFKSSPGIDCMFRDKGGACSVYAAFWALVELGVKQNIVITLGIAENTLSGSCYRTSDIITSHSGLTVEILNTDAEGRLVLADCMSWAQDNYKLTHLVELSTLTGAMGISTYDRAGLFSDAPELIQELLEQGDATGERLCVIPLVKECHDALNSQVADMKNSDLQLKGGAIKAALFLKRFVKQPGLKWAHLDIAWANFASKPRGLYLEDGVTGYGVATLIEWIAHKSNFKPSSISN